MNFIIKLKYLMLILIIVFPNVNAVLIAGTEEYKEAYLEHYTEVSELIVLGEIYSKNMGTYIKVKKVIKGDKKLVDNEIVIFEFKVGMDMTCGVGKPEIPQPINTAVAMFVYDKYNLDQPPIFINSYIKQKQIIKITTLLKNN